MKAAEKERENEIKQLSTPRLMKYNDRNNSDSGGDPRNSDDAKLKYNDRNNGESDCDSGNSDDKTLKYNVRNNDHDRNNSDSGGDPSK